MYFTIPEALWNTQSKKSNKANKFTDLSWLVAKHEWFTKGGGGEFSKCPFKCQENSLTHQPLLFLITLSTFSYCDTAWTFLFFTILVRKQFYFCLVSTSSVWKILLKTNKNIMIILWTLTDQKFQNSEIKPSVGYLLVSIIL